MSFRSNTIRSPPCSGRCARTEKECGSERRRRKLRSRRSSARKSRGRETRRVQVKCNADARHAAVLEHPSMLPSVGETAAKARKAACVAAARVSAVSSAFCVSCRVLSVCCSLGSVCRGEWATTLRSSLCCSARIGRRQRHTQRSEETQAQAEGGAHSKAQQEETRQAPTANPSGASPPWREVSLTGSRKQSWRGQNDTQARNHTRDTAEYEQSCNAG